MVSLSDFFLADGSTCYEIGCSTGELIHKIAVHNRRKRIRAIGIDIERDMVAYAREHCTSAPVTFVQGDIVDFDLERADLLIPALGRRVAAVREGQSTRRMEPFSSQANIEMMHRAGFQDVMSVVKYLCFEGFLAIK